MPVQHLEIALNFLPVESNFNSLITTYQHLQQNLNPALGSKNASVTGTLNSFRSLLYFGLAAPIYFQSHLFLHSGN